MWHRSQIVSHQKEPDGKRQNCLALANWGQQRRQRRIQLHVNGGQGCGGIAAWITPLAYFTESVTIQMARKSKSERQKTGLYYAREARVTSILLLHGSAVPGGAFGAWMFRRSLSKTRRSATRPLIHEAGHYAAAIAFGVPNFAFAEQAATRKAVGKSRLRARAI